MEWLTSKGATVWVPIGHSPDCDLVAEVEGRLLRVQVKTTTQEARTPDGHPRCPVSLATRGGNQSWSHAPKPLDPSRFEYLFVHTGQGRRWLIPAAALEAKSGITLGGSKYAEYEIEPGRPIAEIVYGGWSALDFPGLGEYPSGQRMATVNRPAMSFAGSNPASPIASRHPVRPTNYERKLGQIGQAVVNQKRRISIPQRPFFEAGFQNGSRVRVRCDGPGRIVLEQIELSTWAQPVGESRASG